MNFGTAKRLATTSKHLDLSYRGTSINNVTEYKYLGNIVDQHLNFNSNFEKVYKKASGCLRLLKRLRYYLTKESAYHIFTMMILQILTYRSTVKLHFNNTQQRKLKSLEDRAKNIIGRGVPCIINSIKMETCCIVRRSLDNKMCSNFNEYFTAL